MKCKVCENFQLNTKNVMMNGSTEAICTECHKVMVDPEDPKFDGMMKAFLCKSKAN